MQRQLHAMEAVVTEAVSRVACARYWATAQLPMTSAGCAQIVSVRVARITLRVKQVSVSLVERRRTTAQAVVDVNHSWDVPRGQITCAMTVTRTAWHVTKEV